MLSLTKENVLLVNLVSVFLLLLFILCRTACLSACLLQNNYDVIQNKPSLGHDIVKVPLKDELIHLCAGRERERGAGRNTRETVTLGKNRQRSTSEISYLGPLCLNDHQFTTLPAERQVGYNGPSRQLPGFESVAQNQNSSRFVICFKLRQTAILLNIKAAIMGYSLHDF